VQAPDAVLAAHPAGRSGPPAKLCTLLEVKDGAAAGIVDISLVEDGHRFGLSDDGTRLHVEGQLPGA
jgi:hypothetical protein